LKSCYAKLKENRNVSCLLYQYATCRNKDRFETTIVSYFGLNLSHALKRGRNAFMICSTVSLFMRCQSKHRDK